MKLIPLFLLSVFVGVAFGKKLDCLTKELSACMLKLQSTSSATEKTNPCEVVGKAADCFESASAKCKDEAQKAMKDLVNIARDFCNTDSQIFKDFEKYGSCLNNTELRTKFLLDCLADSAANIMKLGKPDMNNIQDYSDKVMEIICPNRENILNCGYGKMKTICGEPHEQYFRKLIDPFNELVKESCDGASIPSISIALIFLQLLIAMFSSRKIF